MKIISFAWTTKALLAGRKTRTRRQWNEKYAAGFKPGDIVQAYDRNPRFKGKRVALIKILSIRKENIEKMPDEDFEREGFAFMNEQGIKIWNEQPIVAFNQWRDQGGEYFVVDFEVMK